MAKAAKLMERITDVYTDLNNLKEGWTPLDPEYDIRIHLNDLTAEIKNFEFVGAGNAQQDVSNLVERVNQNMDQLKGFADCYAEDILTIQRVCSDLKALGAIPHDFELIYDPAGGEWEEDHPGEEYYGVDHETWLDWLLD